MDKSQYFLCGFNYCSLSAFVWNDPRTCMSSINACSKPKWFLQLYLFRIDIMELWTNTTTPATVTMWGCWSSWEHADWIVQSIPSWTVLKWSHLLPNTLTTVYLLLYLQLSDVGMWSSRCLLFPSCLFQIMALCMSTDQHVCFLALQHGRTAYWHKKPVSWTSITFIQIRTNNVSSDYVAIWIENSPLWFIWRQY